MFFFFLKMDPIIVSKFRNLLQKQPPEVFYKNTLENFLKNFVIFTGKQLQGLQAYNFIKKRPQHRFFPVNIAILKNTCEWHLLVL